MSDATKRARKVPRADRAERFRSQATRDLLVRESLALFLKRGYRQTSVQDMVDAAGLTKGAFYHHFGSKDDLLLLAHEMYLDSQMAVLQEVITQALPPSRALELAIEGMVHGVMEHRAEVSLFLEERRSFGGPLFEEVRARRRDFEGAFGDIIRDGVKRGEFKLDDAEVGIAALSIIGMISWTYQWLRNEGPNSAKRTAKVMSKIVVAGLTGDDLVR